jgi:DNA polymerase III delta prime subunit
MSEKVVGHKRQKDFLIRYLKRAELKAPIILYGADGIGKSKLAKESLVEHCAKEIHLEIIEYKPESKASGYTLEQIHSFTKELKTKPFEKSLRAVFFDDAHRFLPVHANALLKTLEELESNTLVFFITYDCSRIMATIRSRSLKLFFQPLSDSELSQVVDAKLDKEAIKLAQGSTARAILFSDPDFIKIKQAFVQAILLTASNRFDQLNPLLDKIQKNLSTKPRSWTNHLLQLHLEFQQDRIKYSLGCDNLTFCEDVSIFKKMSHLDLPDIELLQEVGVKLERCLEMGISTKYILEQALYV